MKTGMIFTVAAFFALNVAVLAAQSAGGDFVLPKSTIDNGGGTSAGGEFSMTGTIAQHDASRQTSSGGEFSLAGGFWARVDDLIFGDGFESD